MRQAIQRAVDRDQLVKVIQNLGDPAYGLMSPDLPYYIDPAKYPDLKDIAYNPDAAKKLLDGTKYAGGKNWPKITMSMRDEGATPRTAAEFIQKSLKDNLGMEMDFNILPSSTAFTTPMYARQFQLIFLRWYVDYPDPQNFYKQVFYSQVSSGKRQAWSDKTYDDLVVKAGAEPDTTKRLAMYVQAEKMLHDQGVYSPLYFGYGYALFKPRMGGIPKTKAGVPQPDWNIFVNMVRSLYVKK